MTALFLAATLSEATLLRMAPMAVEPIVDNVITPVEQKASSAHYGLVSHADGLLATRYAVAYFGYTQKGFYLAVRSSVPEAPQTLTDEDRISLTLLPPGAAKPVVVTKKVSEGRRLNGLVEYGVLCAETELFVPYSDVLPKPKDGEKWGVNMALDFSAERETATWHFGKKGEKPSEGEEELGTLVIDSQAPILSLYQFSLMESWRSTANYNFGYRVVNNSTKPIKMSSASRVLRGVSFSKLNSDKEENLAKVTHKVSAFDGVTVAAGETKPIDHIEWSMWSGTVACFDMDIRADGETVFRRKMSWDISRGKTWKSAGLPKLDVKYFPSYGDTITLRCLANGAKDLVNGRVVLRGVRAGKVHWQKQIANGYGFTQFNETFSIPGLPEDDYEVVFTCEDIRGRQYAHVRTFKKCSFPWQGTAVGKDRLIIPPFKPIKVEKVKAGGEETADRISFLQTGYRTGRNVLWDEVYGKGENLLAAPMSLTLNGREFKVVSSRLLEESPDRVVREVRAESEVEKVGGDGQRSSVSLCVTQDYDYDGFCWVRFDFHAPQAVDVKSLRLTVPMKDNLVKYRDQLSRGDVRAGPAPDVSVPAGEGLVWESFTNAASVGAWTKSRFDSKIVPYLYLGGNFKGLAFLIESMRGLSVSWEKAPQRLVRKGEVLSYEFDLVQKPTTWSGKQRIEFGFQPTPVKPKDPAHGKFGELMYNYLCPSNAICAGYTTSLDLHHCNTPRANYYPNDDRSLLNYVRAAKAMDSAEYKKRLADYVERNRAWLEACPITSPEAYLSSKSSGVRLMTGGVRPRYFDPMLITSFWPEWEMYKGEWYPEEWTHDNYFNEYMGNLCASRIDKLMWEAKVALDTGDQGLYYDCFFGFASACFPQPDSGAYVRKNGTIQWSLSTIRQWREILKRSAVLCYKQGKLYNGRPVVELHDTEGAVPMLDSWCLTGLSTERGSNGGEFPIRFCESFTLMNIIGGASGKGSHFIVSTNKGDATRQNRELMSLVGYMCAYGIFALEDQGLVANNQRFYKAWNIPFDYGWGEPEVEQFQYWNEDKAMPVTHTGKNVRVSVGKKKDSALVMFGNLGDAETCAFDLSGLGFGPTAKVSDAETGKPFEGNTLSLERFGYKMLLVTR